MKSRLLIIGLTLALFGCLPAVTEVREGPFSVAAPFDEVFTAALELISTDQGVAPYNPGGVNGYKRGRSSAWLMTTSDREAGLIIAEAKSVAAGFIGSDAPPDVHQVNVLLGANGAAQTQVSLRGTPQTKAFLERLKAGLGARFPGP